jgi:hypothetical protein
MQRRCSMDIGRIERIGDRQIPLYVPPARTAPTPAKPEKVPAEKVPA